MKGPQFRGVSGRALDLEYQRIELIKFNSVRQLRNLPDLRQRTRWRWRAGAEDLAGDAPSEEIIPTTRQSVATASSLCKGALIRARTLTGICNDIRNPLMGSTGMPFCRNVEFEATFPDLEQTTLTKNRHGGRIGLLLPIRNLSAANSSHVCNHPRPRAILVSDCPATLSTRTAITRRRHSSMCSPPTGSSS